MFLLVHKLKRTFYGTLFAGFLILVYQLLVQVQHNIFSSSRSEGYQDFAQGIHLSQESRGLLDHSYLTADNDSTYMWIQSDLGNKRSPGSVYVPHLSPVPDDLDKLEGILSVLDNVQKDCDQSPLPDSAVSYCPCVPVYLEGRKYVNTTVALTYTWHDVSSVLNHLGLSIGGTWQPQECVSRRKVLIIVPYKDREAHLKAFLVHMHPILQRQLLDYRIILVEQRSPILFNKAAMMNAGFQESLRRGWPKPDCVIFHDIDMLLEDDRHLLCQGVHASSKAIHHYGAFLRKWNYTVCCGALMGGAVAMHPDQFIAINGYSNLYFGWGGEDDDFYHRLTLQKFHITRPSKYVAQYTTIQHSKDKANPAINRRRPSSQPLKDGLTTLNYSVARYEETAFFTWMFIDLDGLSYYEPQIAYGMLKGECPQSRTLASLSVIGIAGQLSCLEKCRAKEQCTAYVLMHRNTTHSDCLLKTGWPPCGLDAGQPNLGSPQPSDQAMSFIEGTDIKLQESALDYIVYHADCRGHDFHDAIVTLPQCAKLCNSDPQCAAFTYARQNSRCWMKDQCSAIDLQQAADPNYVMSYVRRNYSPAVS